MSMNAFDLFGKIYDLPASVRNPLLSAGIPRILPITAGLKLKVERLDDERSELTMPFHRKNRNHVGSIYLGALLIQAEVTMALYALSVCRPPDFRVLVKRNEADFHARATSTVRAVCAPPADERAALDACRALGAGDKGDAWVTVTTKAEDAAPICTVRFLVNVKRLR